eukprot:NODE_5741_length_642_cov_27.566610_g5351_i0.p1 GENE.NODE_5741_length_642_cov_27.566610_g5351_i0~~NODE_5741_length_642_cov_27.566610_g5351_i0.p1  ORF type:complete len:164 (+),score=3.81 NODE_5741_length_642_cov_27.566610_g5351_i0:66-557(+)
MGRFDRRGNHYYQLPLPSPLRRTGLMGSMTTKPLPEYGSTGFCFASLFNHMFRSRTWRGKHVTLMMILPLESYETGEANCKLTQLDGLARLASAPRGEPPSASQVTRSQNFYPESAKKQPQDQIMRKTAAREKKGRARARQDERGYYVQKPYSFMRKTAANSH